MNYNFAQDDVTTADKRGREAPPFLDLSRYTMDPDTLAKRRRENAVVWESADVPQAPV